MPLRDGTERFHQRLDGEPFEHDGARPGLQRCQRVLRPLARRDDHHTHQTGEAPYVGEHIVVVHLQIEQQHVAPRAGERRSNLRRALDLRDDRHFGIEPGEHRRQALPEERVIVRDDDAHRCGHRAHSSGCSISTDARMGICCRSFGRTVAPRAPWPRTRVDPYPRGARGMPNRKQTPARRMPRGRVSLRALATPCRRRSTTGDRGRNRACRSRRSPPASTAWASRAGSRPSRR